MSLTVALDIVADIASMLAALAVLATAWLVWRQIGLQSQSHDKDQRRFLRESINLIHEVLQGEQFREARRNFFGGPHEREHGDLSSEEKGWARYVLSVYGLLARMIRYGAVDENILRDYWRSALYRDWDRLENFVSGDRLSARNGALYSATEQMVARWKEAEEDGDVVLA